MLTIVLLVAALGGAQLSSGCAYGYGGIGLGRLLQIVLVVLLLGGQL